MKSMRKSTAACDTLLRRTYICPSCSHRPHHRSGTPSKRPRLSKSYSTISTTAINATKPIPPHLKSLHEALTNIEKKASEHINISRLRLALQGLESSDPAIRIAVLGLNVQDTARRLIRLLLADALEDEAGWEKEIAQYEGKGGLIIRYGKPQNANIPQRSAVPVLHIQSPMLERLNVEFLVSATSAPGRGESSVPSDAFLVPVVGTPTDFGGREVAINQPVHQSLLVAKGFDELVAGIDLLSRTEFKSMQDRNSVSLSADLPESSVSTHGQVLVSDVARAEQGLAAIRRSVTEATTYEHKWMASGLPQLSRWLATASQTDETDKLKQPVRNLIAALLASAESSVQLDAAAAKKALAARGLDTGSRLMLESAIDQFSRSAHTELQSGLASAWSSKNWRKLAWYKLFWRVDDVDLIVTDLVTSAWLPNTERSVYELSGRLTQAGIRPIMAEMSSQAPDVDPAIETITAPVLETPGVLASATGEILPLQPVIQNTTGQPTIKMQPAPQPIPIASTISRARNTYIYNATTSLTDTAQQLVFRTLSITGMSAGLSGLLYTSELATTMYEAGTVAAVGTVFALFRLQTGWQQATKALEDGLFQEGKTVVSGIVNRMRTLVDSRTQIEEDPVERTLRESAQEAIGKAKKELEDLSSKSS